MSGRQLMKSKYHTFNNKLLLKVILFAKQTTLLEYNSDEFVFF